MKYNIEIRNKAKIFSKFERKDKKNSSHQEREGFEPSVRITRTTD